MLTVRIGYLFLADALEGRGYTSISLQPGLISQDVACTIQILGIISGSNSFIAPTHFCVSSKTTGRFRITSIQEPTHITAVLPLAVGGRTLKDVDSAVVDIFDTGHLSEEHVDW
jgi:hypothetical protein